MTKIPSVEDSVEEFMSQYAWGKFFTIELEQEVRENLVQTLTADRLALLTELRECELLEEEKDCDNCNDCEAMMSCPRKEAHNTLARNIKAHLDELIKSTSI